MIAFSSFKRFREVNGRLSTRPHPIEFDDAALGNHWESLVNHAAELRAKLTRFDSTLQYNAELLQKVHLDARDFTAEIGVDFAECLA